MRASQETLRRFLSPQQYTALIRHEDPLLNPDTWFRHLTSESTDAKSECAFLKELDLQNPQVTALVTVVLADVPKGRAKRRRDEFATARDDAWFPPNPLTGYRSIKGWVETIALLQTRTRVFAHKAEHSTWPSQERWD